MESELGAVADSLFDDSLFEDGEANNEDDLLLRHETTSGTGENRNDINADTTDAFTSEVLPNLGTPFEQLNWQTSVVAGEVLQTPPVTCQASDIEYESTTQLAFPDLATCWEFLQSPDQDSTVKESTPSKDETCQPSLKKRRLSSADTSLPLPALLDTQDLHMQRSQQVIQEVCDQAPVLDESGPEAEDKCPLVSDTPSNLFVEPPRAPDVSCNRLSRVTLDEMFTEEVDLRSMANNKLEPDEEPVCCACLLDLFPEDEDEEQEQEDQIISHGDDTVAEGSATRKAYRIRQRTNDSHLPNSSIYEPVKGESIGLLSSCLHIFHADCIAKWTCTENACCQCKKRYGALAYYTESGIRTRVLSVRKTLQAQTIRRRIVEEEESEESSGRCHVCHQIGDKDSLMTCVSDVCDSTAHWYCLNLEERPQSWKCRDCTRAPIHTVRSAIPQASRRRSERILSSRDRREALKKRLEEQRAHRAEARLYQALSEISFVDLQEPVSPPVGRLLPSEVETVPQKSNVDDLILGTVSLNELNGISRRSTRTLRQAPASTPTPRLLAPLAAKPSAMRPGASLPPVRRVKTARLQPTPTSSQKHSSLENVLASIRSFAERAITPPTAPSAVSHSSPLSTCAHEADVFFDPTELSISLRGSAGSSDISRSTATRDESSSKPLSKSQQPTHTPARPISRINPSRPAPSLIVPKSFLQTAVQATQCKESRKPALKLPLKSCPASITTPSKIVGSTMASKELQEVVASIVERQHPVILSDLRHFFAGKAQQLLQARTRLVESIAEAAVTPQLVCECHRKLASDRRAFWESKRKTLAHNICSVQLIIDAQARRNFLSQLAISMLSSSR